MQANGAAADDGRTKKILAAMATFGMRPDVISVLSDFAEIKLSLDDQRFLEGPIIVHGGGGWSDSVPKWMFGQARAERAEIVLGQAPEGMLVGPAEIGAVMYSAMMASPMQHDTTQLYLWATATASARHFNRPIADIWKSLNMAPIEDDEVLKDGRSDLHRHYRSLCEEIRRKVIAAATARGIGKAPRKVAVAAAAVPQAPSLPKAVQRTLFDCLA